MSDGPDPKGDRGLAARALARARRDAIARRSRRIRLWVATTSVCLFMAAFLVVYVQLASGHDPALVKSAERRSSGASKAVRPAPERDSSEGDDDSDSTAEEPSGESSSASESESSGPSELRTSQS